jgi:predicted AlkP superfamily pyrophosphatase or phosphodiesterase
MHEEVLIMTAKWLGLAGVVLAGTLASAAAQGIPAVESAVGPTKIEHVMMLSIDGMHAVDFLNCAQGIAGVNNGSPYCPNLAALGQTGINYVAAMSSTPSDSFPGLAALVTGGSSKTHGLYYDVAYDRSLAPPVNTTGTGLAGGHARPTQRHLEQPRTSTRASPWTIPS